MKITQGPDHWFSFCWSWHNASVWTQENSKCSFYKNKTTKKTMFATICLKWHKTRVTTVFREHQLDSRDADSNGSCVVHHFWQVVMHPGPSAQFIPEGSLLVQPDPTKNPSVSRLSLPPDRLRQKCSFCRNSLASQDASLSFLGGSSLIFPMSFCLYLCPAISTYLSLSLREN